MEEHRDLQKLVRKSSGKSKLQSKEIATKRENEQLQEISFDWNHRSAAATSSMSLKKFQKKSSWN